MSKFDKKLYKGLLFFANNTLREINNIRKQNKKNYNKKVPKEIEKHLFEYGYVNIDYNKVYAITPEGLKQLRTLERIKHSQKTLWISIVAVTISLVALAINYFNGGF